ncbi:uncharacterized protein ARB_06572 [Trichophyton benhamiae CBS 112371]|uniref:Uncharacterized protein n=1 Tax=Arthroderma benhamiae (strain ATCC MYA-4681 / CBS 112371) TaxID=663331 RepID=D4AQR2_ARTBC|nr:uncharacterized protein ARB_06572 [Trichophyton benhamiae CBS 112371]EFE34806.1 hypothetical protein ARB_06572 [Trichophyton benhamiae CBS 112371]
MLEKGRGKENIDRPACQFQFLDEVEECPSIYPRETPLSLNEDSVLGEEEKTITPTVATSSLLLFQKISSFMRFDLNPQSSKKKKKKGERMLDALAKPQSMLQYPPTVGLQQWKR